MANCSFSEFIQLFIIIIIAVSSSSSSFYFVCVYLFLCKNKIEWPESVNGAGCLFFLLFWLVIFCLFCFKQFFSYEGSECFCSIACPFTFYLLLTEKSIFRRSIFCLYLNSCKFWRLSLLVWLLSLLFVVVEVYKSKISSHLLPFNRLNTLYSRRTYRKWKIENKWKWIVEWWANRNK